MNAATATITHQPTSSLTLAETGRLLKVIAELKGRMKQAPAGRTLRSCRRCSADVPVSRLPG